MKHLNILSSALLALLLLVGALSGCAGSADSDNDDTAHFRYFRYTGNDRTGTLPLDTLPHPETTVPLHYIYTHLTNETS